MLFPAHEPSFNDIVSFIDAWPGFDTLKPVQSTCNEMCIAGTEPGLAIIEAPTGDGKTEAAMYVASRWISARGLDGLYFALPSMATSNQMHGRVKKFMDRLSGPGSRTGLVHGMAWLIDEETQIDGKVEVDTDTGKHGEDYFDWFKPSKKALLAPVAVGTIDQLLMAALKVKFGVLRLLGISSKAIIVDEVHAYDAYMTRILARLLEWASAFAIPVLLLSATLPASKREILCRAYGGNTIMDVPGNTGSMEYPLVTVVTASGKRSTFAVPSGNQKTITIVPHDILGSPGNIALLSVDIASRGKCVCTIANTVKSAQETYREIKKLPGSNDIIVRLFHSRFIASRRSDIEHEIERLFGKDTIPANGEPAKYERPRKAILVATQVVEQSLDLDFDEMVSEIAPIDLLLQRAGRVHRHDRPSRPEPGVLQLHVILPGNDGKLGTTALVYDEYIVRATMSAIDGLDRDANGNHVISIPGDTRRLIEAVYASDPGDDDVSIDRGRDRHDSKERKSAGMASRYLFAAPSPRSFSIGNQEGFAYDESEGESSTYFSARTRIGRDAFPVILVEGDEFRDVISGSKVPPRKVAREIYHRLVQVPSYWVRGITFNPEPPWIHRAHVMRMHGGRWSCQSDDGKRTITITYDDEYGLMNDEKEDW
jgi:CRISPR-associated endonuclease/helicase Cas3